MKKITLLSLVCLLSVAGMAVTRDTLYWDNFPSSYPAAAQSPKTITVNEKDYAIDGMRCNGKNAPTGWWWKQFIQLRKPTASSTAGSITNITDFVNMTKVLVLAYGADAAGSFSVAFGEETPIEYNDASVKTSVEKKTLVHGTASEEGDTEDVDCKWYEFTNTNNATKFKLTNIGNLNYFIYIVIECEDSSTGIEDAIAPAPKAYKVIENGQIVVVRNGVKYNAAGTVIGTVE